MIERKMRHSQALSPYGVGAILDFRGESFVACDISRWNLKSTEVISSPRLCEALNVQMLRAAPAIPTGQFAGLGPGIPYLRFPGWLFCPKCRRLFRWRPNMEQEDKVPTCAGCPRNQKLVPMRWVIICEAGHLTEMDWPRWAHSRSRDRNGAQCQDPKLKFLSRSVAGSGGLDTLSVKCETCGSQRNLMGIAAKEAMKHIGVKCSGRQPWQAVAKAIDCAEVPKVVQRGASNVHFPVIHSSIEIPRPGLAEANDEVAIEIRNDNFFQGLVSNPGNQALKDIVIGQLVAKFDVDRPYVERLLAEENRQEDQGGTVVQANVGDLLSEEWAAFLTPSSEHDSRGFVTRHVGLSMDDTGATSAPEVELADRVSRVVVADRLREVRALEGFFRGRPAESQRMIRADLGLGTNWLPAIEVRGEGIFLSLDEPRLADWEVLPEVRERVRELELRADRSFMSDRFKRQTGSRLLPRYILLHTLAHALLRRLSFESGYSASSIRERIYARHPETEDDPKQAGVLLYTAAGDSEGTLGGLVRQGEPPRFSRTLLESLIDSKWCSNDPLCMENAATSFDSLNLAACHACCFSSETSCESGNFLLDRALLVGMDGIPGFFEPVTDAALNAGVVMTS